MSGSLIAAGGEGPLATGPIRFVSGATELVGHLAVPIGSPRPRPALVLCHGFPSFSGGEAYADVGLAALADRLATSLGWIVCSFACRGCGASGGDFSLVGWLDDISSVARRVKGTQGVGAVWLAGFGTGGALAICAAARDDAIRGVAAISAPASFSDWAHHPRRLLEFAREVGVVRTAGYPPWFDRWAGELRQISAVQDVEALANRQLLVVHGSMDQSVPTLDARELADAHGAAELRVIHGAGHDLRVDPRAIATLIGWLDRQEKRWQAGDGVP